MIKRIKRLKRQRFKNASKRMDGRVHPRVLSRPYTHTQATKRTRFSMQKIKKRDTLLQTIQPPPRGIPQGHTPYKQQDEASHIGLPNLKPYALILSGITRANIALIFA